MSTIAVSEIKERHVEIRRASLTFALAVLSMIGPFSIDTYLPSLPSIGRSLNAPAAEVQQTVTAFLLFFAIMSVWHGAISDAYGRRRLTLISLAVFCVASAGCGLSQSVAALMFFRGLQGATAGAGMIVGRAVIRDLFEGAAAQKLMSQVLTIFTVAPVIAPVAGGYLETWFGWRSIFVFLVFLAGFLWFSCFRALPETLPVQKRQRLEPVFLGRSYWKVLTHIAFLMACASMAFANAGFFIYIISAPVFLMKYLHLGATQFLWLYLPISVAMAIGAWISGCCAGKISGNQTILLGYVIMSMGAIGNVVLNLVAPPMLPWSILPVFIYTMGMQAAMPSLTLLTLDLFPMQRGLAASCQGFISLGANTIVSGCVPLFWGSTLSLAWTEMGMLVLAVITVLLYAVSMKKHTA